MSSKRHRRGPVDITCIPDEVLHIVITFAESTLSRILALQRVNRHFRRLMRLPIMVSHLDLSFQRPTDLLQLGPHAAGLHRVRFATTRSLQLIQLTPSLRELNLSCCKTLSDDQLSSVCNLTQLRSLIVVGCPKLKDLSFLSLASSLRVMNISNCANITGVPPCNLMELEMNSCTSVWFWEPLRYMSNLTNLSMRECVLTDQVLECLPRGLRTLNLAMNRELTDAGLHNVTRSPVLHTLNLSGCSKLTTLAPLAALIHLVDLRLVFCFGLQNIDALRSMTNLRIMHAPHSDLACEALRGGLVGLRSLDELDLSHTRTTHMGFDAPMPNLRKLEMRFCYMLHDLQGIEHAAALRTLDLGGCSAFDDASLRSLTNLAHLRNLHLNGCSHLTDTGLAVIGQMRTLRRLGLFGCRLITNEGLSELAGLDALHTLDLQNCQSVSDEGLHSLSGLRRMRCLNLGGCTLTDAGLFALVGMPELHSLNLDGCRKITDVGLRALSNLSNLRQIVLSRCRVETLQALSKMSQLMSINLSGCGRITDTSLLNLTNCTQLKALNVSHCKKVSKFGVERFWERVGT